MASYRFVEQLGYLFYGVGSNKTSFEKPEEVPNYYVQVIPHFVLFILLENCILLYKKKSIIRLNDAAGSISQGMFHELSKLVILNVQLVAYSYVYNKWRLVTLPWDSPWTWWLCFIGVDFCYYWFHRASHEINILWASHQVHHSSEEYNLSTGLRQSVLQPYSIWVLYLPLALAIPPGVFLVHAQFNLLYQFWIHTQVITSLGPLEYIFNTASHHRVHHGRNRYCIDKNYAGVLIIWDRMFGTFQSEKEEVVYGLTHPINSFELFYIQFFYYIHLWKKFWEINGFWNKISVLFKGPGWSPGTPWHGNVEDIPEVKGPVEKFDPPLPFWCKLYTFFHMLVIVLAYYEVGYNPQPFSPAILWSFFLYEIFSMSIIGMLFEGRLYAQWVELFRCFVYLIIDYFFLSSTEIYKVTPIFESWMIIFLRTVFVVSFIFWLQYCLRSVTIKMYSSKLNKME